METQSIKEMFKLYEINLSDEEEKSIGETFKHHSINPTNSKVKVTNSEREFRQNISQNTSINNTRMWAEIRLESIVFALHPVDVNYEEYIHFTYPREIRLSRSVNNENVTRSFDKNIVIVRSINVSYGKELVSSETYYIYILNKNLNTVAGIVFTSDNTAKEE